MANKLKIESGMMFLAVSDTTRAGGAADTGFLNRKTGQVVFVYENESQAPDDDCQIDAVFDRAAVEASPDEWLEIPKYDPSIDGHDNQEAFIDDFLGDNGIDAEWE